MLDNYKHSDITSLIIKGYYAVYNKLGYGFLEKVYENALAIELQKLGLNCKLQYAIHVFYDNEKVGFYIADMLVNDCVIIEIKAAECICEEHEAQLTNYLKATDIEVGILLNFGKKPEFKRKVFSTEFKNLNSSSSS
ncbi:MAG: GxxExxY protein [Ferruginibacter sp.]|nr:GxxExxY protein [Ferruginibacter sp.]